MIKMWIGIGLPVAVLDQAIKMVIRQKEMGAELFRIPGIIAITPCFNTGAAFSLFSGKTVLLAVLSGLLLLAICRYAIRSMHWPRMAQAALGCVIGGGIGNLIDRLAYGGVTDYIRLLFLDFPVFNVADMAVTGGIAVLMVLLLTGSIEETTGEGHGSEN